VTGIEHWDVSRLGELAPVYNAQIVGAVPHCYPVSAEQLAAFTTSSTMLDNVMDALDRQQLIVVRDGAHLRGFAHVSSGMIMSGEGSQTGGFIHFLTYERGCRGAGQALLDACEAYLAEDSPSSRIWAFDGHFYRFYHLGYPLVSDHMGHVYGLLGMNGYAPVAPGEVFLHAPDFEVTPAPPPDDRAAIEVAYPQDMADRPGINLRVTKGKTHWQVGVCYARSAGEFCRAPEAQETLVIEGLGISKPWHNKGWGRYLLLRTLDEARQLGYRHTTISTARNNYRAQLFYTNYGYRVTDTVYSFVKSGT
jgi:GNAT superfamily N-acetyltransferase